MRKRLLISATAAVLVAGSAWLVFGQAININMKPSPAMYDQASRGSPFRYELMLVVTNGDERLLALGKAGSWHNDYETPMDKACAHLR